MMRRCSSRLSCVRALAAALLLATLVVASPPQTVGATPPAATFANPFSIPTGGSPGPLLVHNFSGGPCDDVVLGLQFTNIVKVFRNNNCMGFFPPDSYTVGTGNPGDPAADPFAIVFGDFNGDGKDDLAVLNNGQTTLTILQGNGTGGFIVKPFINLNGPPYNLQYPWWMAAADVNNDGKSDLLFTDITLNGVAVLLGNGNNTFSSGGFFATAPDPQGLVVGDFNGDGKPDLATSNEASNSISVLIGNGNGTFKPHMDYPTGTSPAEITRIAIGFEKTFMGLAVANEGSNSVGIFIGNGDGTFLPRTDVPVPIAPFGLSVGFLNPDGQPDINVCARGSGAVGALLQDAGSWVWETFVSGSSIGPASLARCRKADGHIFSQSRDDMAVINSASGNLTVFKNTATSSKPPPTITDVSSPCKKIKTPVAEYSGGTFIEIDGMNFDNSATVYINGQKATRLGTQISTVFVVAVPPSQEGAEITDIKVVNPDGQFSEREQGITYTNPLANDTVSGITPASVGTGGEQQATITGTNFTPGTEVLAGGICATNITVVNPTTITFLTPPALNGAPGPVDVTVQNPTTGATTTVINGILYVLPQVSPSTGNRPPGPNIPSVPLVIPLTPHDPSLPQPLPSSVPPDLSQPPRHTPVV